MSERVRTQAFTGVCIVVGAAVVALLALGEGSDPPRRAVSAARTAPSPERDTPGARAQPPPRTANPGPGSDPGRARWRERLGSPAFLRREKPRVLAAAARFLRAFCAYDAGSRERNVIADVRALSTTALARRLLDAPAPRLPRTIERPPTRARLVAMSAEFDQPPSAAIVRVSSVREGRHTVSGLLLVLRDGQWRASQLTE